MSHVERFSRLHRSFLRYWHTKSCEIRGDLLVRVFCNRYARIVFSQTQIQESLEGPSLAKVKDLEEQGWVTEAEAHKEFKELKAIRDDIHQEVRNVFDRIRLQRAAAGRAELLAYSSSTTGGIQKVEQTAPLRHGAAAWASGF